MIEKVNPCHPDKVADRIAGAIVDLAYSYWPNPRIAVEVLIGHGICHAIIETDARLDEYEIEECVKRITDDDEIKIDISIHSQDVHLNDNQRGKIRCGDNGIFKGMPLTDEQREIAEIARYLYETYESDGKYILDGKRLIICQSNAKTSEIKEVFDDAEVNPIGFWTGGTDVDTGATNRKLGSDMADAVTGGGLHGKDLSKADISVNIYAFLKAQVTGKPVEICCAIGDEIVDGRPYEEIVKIAHDYIIGRGGFEKFAEWGLF